MYCSRIAEYSSWPAVSSTSSSATSSSTMHCFRYESAHEGCQSIGRDASGRHGKGKGMRTLNGRVIFVDEMRLDQLDCEARLADATTADHHQLVFSRELQRHRARSVSKSNGQGAVAHERNKTNAVSSHSADRKAGTKLKQHTLEAIVAAGTVREGKEKARLESESAVGTVAFGGQKADSSRG
jgi:hypothetical protein